jgi:hypothetical protein
LPRWKHGLVVSRAGNRPLSGIADSSSLDGQAPANCSVKPVAYQAAERRSSTGRVGVVAGGRFTITDFSMSRSPIWKTCSLG